MKSPSSATLAREIRHSRMLTGLVNPPHGRYSTYVNYSCRCDPCRAANRDYARKQAEKRKREAEEK